MAKPRSKAERKLSWELEETRCHWFRWQSGTKAWIRARANRANRKEGKLFILKGLTA